MRNRFRLAALVLLTQVRRPRRGAADPAPERLPDRQPSILARLGDMSCCRDCCASFHLRSQSGDGCCDRNYHPWCSTEFRPTNKA
jgi:hypothetical protein